MVKVYPNHLFNQEITVISGGTSYDEYGIETYSSVVVSSGSARLQFTDERVIDETGAFLGTLVKVWTTPTISGVVGQLVEIDSRKYRINGAHPQFDGRGVLRLNEFTLTEVLE